MIKSMRRAKKREQLIKKKYSGTYTRQQLEKGKWGIRVYFYAYIDEFEVFTSKPKPQAPPFTYKKTVYWAEELRKVIRHRHKLERGNT